MIRSSVSPSRFHILSEDLEEGEVVAEPDSSEGEEYEKREVESKEQTKAVLPETGNKKEIKTRPS